MVGACLSAGAMAQSALAFDANAGVKSKMTVYDGTALDGGVSVNELKDAFAQLYAYTGFPRSLNALNTLEHVLSERESEGIVDYEGKRFHRPAVWDDAKLALQFGTDMQTRDEGGTPWNYSFCPQADYYMKSHLFGDIFACDQFTPAERELLTVSALSAMDGVAPQFEGHKECAVFMGNTKEQVDYLCRWLEEKYGGHQEVIQQ